MGGFGISLEYLMGGFGKSLGYLMGGFENISSRVSANLTFPFSIVNLEVDIADREAAVPLHHGHAVLAGEEAHRL